MIVRLLQRSDLKRVVAIDQEVFPSSWNETMFLYEYHDNPYATIYVLEINQEIIGFIDFWLLEDQCQLARIAIITSMQGNGYAKALMEKCIIESKKMHVNNVNLEVRISNQKAICLYQSFGFDIVATRKKYYSDNHEDAYVMVKKMGGK